MHHIHQTEGIIIDTINTHQSDRAFFVFTKELGLVIATAKSVREVRSKLRFHLQKYNSVRLSLVRGRSGWKIVGAEVFSPWPTLFGKGSEKLFIFARVAGLLRRLLSGEEPLPELYETVSSGLLFLKNLEHDPEKMRAFEALLVLRIVHVLGYVGESPSVSLFCKEAFVWNGELVDASLSVRSELLLFINRALKESHL